MGEYLASMGPAVANHLWQSTVFAAVAWVVALTLRKNQARARYWIWTTASLKFAVPFALLISVGGVLPRPRHTVMTMPVYSAVDEVELPFSVESAPTAAVVVSHISESRYGAPGVVAALPVALTGVWLCGAVVVLAVWWVRWRQVAGTLRRAVAVEPAQAELGSTPANRFAGDPGGRGTRDECRGREAELLRQVERKMGGRTRVRLALSGELMEPGVFGVFRPVLIWPERLSERLDDEHIEAILAHELMHVRRRDNLTAAVHMLVEAAFWFHPAVWWIGARLVEERERACDEAVVAQCGRPEAYARSILKVCEFCVESPVACVAGVTGADLKQRVLAIMTRPAALKLTLGKKVLLVAATVCALAVPVVLGQAQAARRMMLAAVSAAPRPVRAWVTAHAMIDEVQTPYTGLIAEVQADKAVTNGAPGASGPAFAAVTVRPSSTDVRGGRFYGMQFAPSGGVVFSSMVLKSLVWFAYSGSQERLLVDGGPKWTETDQFDINAQVDKADLPDWDKLSDAQRLDRVRPLLQTLLEQRFKLKGQTASISTPVYVLVPAKGGSKLREVPAPTRAELQDDEQRRQAHKATDPPQFGLDVTDAGWVGHAVKVQELMGGLGYALGVQDKPLLDQTGLNGYYDLTLRIIKQEGGPTPAKQVEEQLGLRVEARNVPMKTFVIESAEKPAIDAAAGTAPTPVAAPMPPPPPHIHFDVVSWKRCGDNAVKGSGRVDMPLDSDFVAYHCQPIYRVIYFAFVGPTPFRLSGHPSWVDDDLYEFQAKVAPDDIAAWKAMTINDRRIAVRDILADQLKLQIHVDKTPQPAYALTVAKGGPKLAEYKVGEQWKLPDGRILQGRAQEFFGDVGYLQNSTMSNFAADLSARLDRPVVDQTGLTGSYDISLPLTKATGADPFANISDEGGSVESGLEQLGLKLVPTKTEADGFVVDHIERPAEN